MERYLSWDSTAWPDGEYRVRVTASDAPGQSAGGGADGAPGRRPVLDRQHAATITALAAARPGGKLQVKWHAADALNNIAKAEYSLDGGEWKVAAPVTRLSDGAGAGLRAQSGRCGGRAYRRRAGGRRVRECGGGERRWCGRCGHSRKLEPILPKSSRVFTTSVLFQRLGKCFLLPVTRKSARAASAHFQKTGYPLHREMLKPRGLA